MTPNLLFWLNEDLMHYCIANSISKKLDCNMYGIMDIRDEGTKNFLQSQTLVNFQKLWSTHDEIIKNKKNPDLEYLRNFEEKFEINLWEISFAERHFYTQYNPYHQFSRDEILSIIQEECRLFERVLLETKPDFLVVNLISRHAAYLLYRMCKHLGIKILTLEFSKFGNRFVVSHQIDRIDTPEKYSEIILKKERTSQELFDYLKKSKPLIGDEYLIKKKISKSEKIKAAVDYFFLPQSDYFNNVFLNYGKTKLNTFYKGSSKRFYLKKSSRQSFLDKNTLKKIPNTPFVYYPLNADPERELHIVGHFYSDALPILKNIAKSLPVGYDLFVKEHPVMQLYGWRSIDFYKKILDIPNVKFFHPSVKSVDLIKKCSSIVTLTGTVGLEGAFYDKPSVALTEVDYSALPFVTYIENIKELPNAIKNSLKTKVDRKELDKYVTYVHENSVEFDKPAYYRDFLNRFPYAGFRKPLEIPHSDMEIFLHDNEKIFSDLSDEHIKKIKLDLIDD